MSYKRVVPRDFFNEAKLLKSLGRLTLSILDNKQFISKYIYAEFDHEAFDVQQTIDGDIYVANFTVHLKKTDEQIELYSLLNSKENYPLVFIDSTGDRSKVFDEDGKFTDEFMDFVKEANK